MLIVHLILYRFDYSVDASRAKTFYPEIRKYYPNLADGSLEPDYAGIRPKLSGPKQPFMDFLVQVVAHHFVVESFNFFPKDKFNLRMENPEMALKPLVCPVNGGCATRIGACAEVGCLWLNARPACYSYLEMHIMRDEPMLDI